MNVSDFDTRRINFTFRYVPDQHVQPFKALSAEAQRDIEGSMRQLAVHSPFFAAALADAGRATPR